MICALREADLVRACVDAIRATLEDAQYPISVQLVLLRPPSGATHPAAGPMTGQPQQPSLTVEPDATRASTAHHGEARMR